MTTNEPVAEGTILRRIARHDEEAFAELYDRHGGRAYQVALVVLGDAAAAATVVENVFLLVWRTRGSAMDRSAPSESLLALTRREAVNFCARHPSLVRTVTDLELCASFDGDGASPLERSLRATAPLTGRVLLLVGMARLRLTDAAAAAGCSDADAAAALRDALALLRTELRVRQA